MHVHKVSGHSRYLHPVFPSLAIGARSGKTRQQRWMDVEDFVLKMPNKPRRKNLHKPRQHHKVHLKIFRNLQGFLFGFLTFRPVNPAEGNPGLPSDRAELGVIGNHHGRQRFDLLLGNGFQKPAQNVILFGNENREAPHRLPGRMLLEANVHLKFLSQTLQPLPHGGKRPILFLPGRLHSHAEVAARHLLLQRFDIGAHLEQKLGRRRNRPAAIFAHHRNA